MFPTKMLPDIYLKFEKRSKNFWPHAANKVQLQSLTCTKLATFRYKRNNCMEIGNFNSYCSPKCHPLDSASSTRISVDLVNQVRVSAGTAGPGVPAYLQGVLQRLKYG